MVFGLASPEKCIIHMLRVQHKNYHIVEMKFFKSPYSRFVLNTSSSSCLRQSQPFHIVVVCTYTKKYASSSQPQSKKDWKLQGHDSFIRSFLLAALFRVFHFSLGFSPAKTIYADHIMRAEYQSYNNKVIIYRETHISFFFFLLKKKDEA